MSIKVSPDAYEFDADSWIPLVRPVKPTSRTIDTSSTEAKTSKVAGAKNATKQSAKVDVKSNGHGNGHADVNGRIPILEKEVKI